MKMKMIYLTFLLLTVLLVGTVSALRFNLFGWEIVLFEDAKQEQGNETTISNVTPIKDKVVVEPELVECGNFHKTVKVGDTYSTTIGRPNAREDGQCKPVAEARSLKGNSGFRCIVTKDSKDDPDVECLDFNYTSITFNVSDKIDEYPIRVIDRENTVKLQLPKARLVDEIKIGYEQGDVIHIGENSSTIQLEGAYATTEGRIDYKNGVFSLARDNYEKATAGEYYDGANYYWYRGFIKFDLSPIPDNAYLLGANLVMFLDSETGNGENANVDIKHIEDIGSTIDSTDWSKTVIHSYEDFITCCAPGQGWFAMDVSTSLNETSLIDDAVSYQTRSDIEDSDSSYQFYHIVLTPETEPDNDPYLEVNYTFIECTDDSCEERANNDFCSENECNDVKYISWHDSPAIKSALNESLDIVLYYDFEECTGTLIHDYSDSGNNATYTDPVWNNTDFNSGSCALECLDDTASPWSLVEIPADPSLNISNNFTILFYIKPTVVGSDDNIYRVDDGNGGWARIEAGSMWWIANGLSDTSYFAQPVDSGVWQSFGFTYNGSKKSFFKNITDIEREAATGNQNDWGTLINFRARAENAGEFEGKIDDFLVSNRSFNDAEMQQIMQLGIYNMYSNFTVNFTMPVQGNTLNISYVGLQDEQTDICFYPHNASSPQWYCENTTAITLTGVIDEIQVTFMLNTSNSSKTPEWYSWTAEIYNTTEEAANNAPTLSHDYPTNNTVSENVTNIIAFTPSDADSDAINVSLINASNNVVLSANNSIVSGTQTYYGLTMVAGDEIKFYYNYTDNGTILMSGIFNFSISSGCCTTNSWDCDTGGTVAGFDAGGNPIYVSGSGTITITDDVTNCNTAGDRIIRRGSCELKRVGSVQVCGT